MMAKNAVATMTKWMGMSTKLGTTSTAATMVYDKRNTSSIVVRLVVEGYAWPLLPGTKQRAARAWRCQLQSAADGRCDAVTGSIDPSEGEPAAGGKAQAGFGRSRSIIALGVVDLVAHLLQPALEPQPRGHVGGEMLV